MSGRRLLDFARLFGAARGIAAQHTVLRRQQLDVFNRTSSIWKLIQSSGQQSAQRYSNIGATKNDSSEGPIPSTRSVERDSPAQPVTKKDEDVFYDRSEAHTAQDPVPKDSIRVSQREATEDPLPDGSIPPTDSPVAQEQHKEHDSSPPTQRLSDASRSRVAQRQSESQIPSTGAEPPESTVQQDQDTHYTSDARSSPVLSSLPRIKLPKNSANIQLSDEHVADEGINQDVFYKSKPTAASNTTDPSTEENLPEEVYAQLFHSRKVAGKLTGQTPPYGFRKGPQHQQTQSEDNRHPLDTRPQQQTEDVQNSAKDIAKDVGESLPVSSPQIELDRTDELTGYRQVDESVNIGSTKPYKMHESKVPSSRFGRLWQYGGLATSMAFGAVGESFRRATGSSNGSSGSSILSSANIERLVSKLSRMRGAALKLGQMMSFQDSKMLPKEIHQVLQRVQDSADYMPASQRNQVLASNLGENWQDLFSSFEEVPMAAASIGQVHGAILRENGMRVAVKVQYPGVAGSIDSDLNNLSLLLTASKLLPKGLYLDKTIANARTELAWECDYVREADAAKRFRSLLKDEKDIFVVPEIIDSASGPQVLTMERMEGVGVTKVQNFTQEQKDWIGMQILRLCLREIIEFRYMQTDPNWTNFLYNAKTNKLELLDFGASREYPDKFIIPYIKVLQAAARNDRVACRDISIELGYLTGHESKAMLDAHVDSMLTLAEPFRDSSPDVYDFQDQTITDRVRALIPVMLRERLAPPPEETYSLHRKLSGAFLLCARLGSKIKCKELFARAMDKASFS